ncbi:MAG: hypothetical protein KC433_22140 [Anaerolineales bacterium]|nr:hypothetical protein [Anaerolineales bacterium]MCB8940471.1 hypothetical protein [Ardenticatenaceae bacterium]
MKKIVSNKTYRRFALVGGLIPLLLILNIYYGLPDIVFVVLFIFLSLIFGSMALWVYANRHADGSEWWQDDSASGWRGY